MTGITHLLPTPGDVVSITSTFLWGKQPFSVTKEVTYSFSLPSLSGLESPVNQTDKPNNYFFPSLQAWRFPSAKLITPCQPWRSQAPRKKRWWWWPRNRAGKRNSTQGPAYKTKQLPVLRERLRPELLLDSETCNLVAARDVSTILCFLLYLFYTGTANHPLKIWPALQRAQVIRNYVGLYYKLYIKLLTNCMILIRLVEILCHSNKFCAILTIISY